MFISSGGQQDVDFSEIFRCNEVIAHQLIIHAICGHHQFLNMIRLARPVFILATLLSSNAVTAHSVACCPFAAVVATSAQRNFLISAVLTRHGNSADIQLLHTVRNGTSGDEALGKFTRDALAQYPAYSIASTLVSEVKTFVKANPCGIDA